MLWARLTFDIDPDPCEVGSFDFRDAAECSAGTFVEIAVEVDFASFANFDSAVASFAVIVAAACFVVIVAAASFAVTVVESVAADTLAFEADTFVAAVGPCCPSSAVEMVGPESCRSTDC